MKILKYMKDGGPESNAWGFFLVEIKGLFSVALLKFDGESREAFHSHAFNSISWLIKGSLIETFRDGMGRYYIPSLTSIKTTRDTFHQVSSLGVSYAITFRGPWSDTWKEFLPNENKEVTLTHGRKIV